MRSSKVRVNLLKDMQQVYTIYRISNWVFLKKCNGGCGGRPCGHKTGRFIHDAILLSKGLQLLFCELTVYLSFSSLIAQVHGKNANAAKFLIESILVTRFCRDRDELPWFLQPRVIASNDALQLPPSAKDRGKTPPLDLPR